MLDSASEEAQRSGRSVESILDPKLELLEPHELEWIRAAAAGFAPKFLVDALVRFHEAIGLYSHCFFLSTNRRSIGGAGDQAWKLGRRRTGSSDAVRHHAPLLKAPARQRGPVRTHKLRWRAGLFKSAAPFRGAGAISAGSGAFR